MGQCLQGVSHHREDAIAAATSEAARKTLTSNRSLQTLFVKDGGEENQPFLGESDSNEVRKDADAPLASAQREVGPSHGAPAPEKGTPTESVEFDGKEKDVVVPPPLTSSDQGGGSGPEDGVADPRKGGHMAIVEENKEGAAVDAEVGVKAPPKGTAENTNGRRDFVQTDGEAVGEAEKEYKGGLTDEGTGSEPIIDKHMDVRDNSESVSPEQHNVFETDLMASGEPAAQHNIEVEKNIESAQAAEADGPAKTREGPEKLDESIADNETQADKDQQTQGTRTDLCTTTEAEIPEKLSTGLKTDTSGGEAVTLDDTKENMDLDTLAPDVYQSALAGTVPAITGGADEEETLTAPEEKEIVGDTIEEPGDEKAEGQLSTVNRSQPTPTESELQQGEGGSVEEPIVEVGEDLEPLAETSETVKSVETQPEAPMGAHEGEECNVIAREGVLPLEEIEKATPIAEKSPSEEVPGSNIEGVGTDVTGESDAAALDKPDDKAEPESTGSKEVPEDDSNVLPESAVVRDANEELQPNLLTSGVDEALESKNPEVEKGIDLAEQTDSEMQEELVAGEALETSQVLNEDHEDAADSTPEALAVSPEGQGSPEVSQSSLEEVTAGEKGETLLEPSSNLRESTEAKGVELEQLAIVDLEGQVPPEPSKTLKENVLDSKLEEPMTAVAEDSPELEQLAVREPEGQAALLFPSESLEDDVGESLPEGPEISVAAGPEEDAVDPTPLAGIEPEEEERVEPSQTSEEIVVDSKGLEQSVAEEDATEPQQLAAIEPWGQAPLEPSETSEENVVDSKSDGLESSVAAGSEEEATEPGEQAVIEPEGQAPAEPSQTAVEAKPEGLERLVAALPEEDAVDPELLAKEEGPVELSEASEEILVDSKPEGLEHSVAAGPEEDTTEPQQLAASEPGGQAPVEPSEASGENVVDSKPEGPESTVAAGSDEEATEAEHQAVIEPEGQAPAEPSQSAVEDAMDSKPEGLESSVAAGPEEDAIDPELVAEMEGPVDPSEASKEISVDSKPEGLEHLVAVGPEEDATECQQLAAIEPDGQALAELSEASGENVLDSEAEGPDSSVATGSEEEATDPEQQAVMEPEGQAPAEPPQTSVQNAVDAKPEELESSVATLPEEDAVDPEPLAEGEGLAELSEASKDITLDSKPEGPESSVAALPEEDAFDPEPLVEGEGPAEPSEASEEITVDSKPEGLEHSVAAGPEEDATEHQQLASQTSEENVLLDSKTEGSGTSVEGAVNSEPAAPEEDATKSEGVVAKSDTMSTKPESLLFPEVLQVGSEHEGSHAAASV